MLFTIVLLSETLGWIPSVGQAEESGASGIMQWPAGTSLLEMLIVQGAFLTGNANGKGPKVFEVIYKL